MTDETAASIPIQPQAPSHAQRYADMCSRAGDMQYKIYIWQGELKDLNEQIKTLNLEAKFEMDKAEAIRKAIAAKDGDAALKAANLKPVPEPA